MQVRNVVMINVKVRWGRVWKTRFWFCVFKLSYVILQCKFLRCI